MAEAVDPPFDRPDAGFNALEGWTWIGCYGGYYLQADLLIDFEHGFFTRQWQGRGPEVLAGYVSAGVSVHRPQQVHSARVLPASEASAEPWPEADGLVSDAGGQSLWVCGADCTPVLLADPVSGRVAACHAGWRGVTGGIVLRAIERLEAVGCRRGDLLVALGPAVGGVHYQVERGVAEQVAVATPGEAWPPWKRPGPFCPMSRGWRPMCGSTSVRPSAGSCWRRAYGPPSSAAARCARWRSRCCSIPGAVINRRRCNGAASCRNNWIRIAMLARARSPH